MCASSNTPDRRRKHMINGKKERKKTNKEDTHDQIGIGGTNNTKNGNIIANLFIMNMDKNKNKNIYLLFDVGTFCLNEKQISRTEITEEDLCSENERMRMSVRVRVCNVVYHAQSYFIVTRRVHAI